MPRNAANDDMMAIWPCPRRAMGTISGITVLTTPSTLTAKIRLVWSTPSTPRAVPPEMPALAMTRSTGWWRSTSWIHAAKAGACVTSPVALTTSAPRRRQSAATCSRRSASRPCRQSVAPGMAKLSARAWPRPLEAPVIRIVLDEGIGCPRRAPIVAWDRSGY